MNTLFHPAAATSGSGLCWALSGVVFFGTQLAAQAVFTPAYSLLDNRISDLGNTTCGPWLTFAFACSPLHTLVNAGFIATGVLFGLGSALTGPAWPGRRLTKAGLACVALAGLGFVLVGLNPENVNIRLHLLGATNLITSNLGLLLLGLSTRRTADWRSWLGLGLAGSADRCVGRPATVGHVAARRWTRGTSGALPVRCLRGCRRQLASVV